MAEDKKYVKLLLSPSGSLPGGSSVDWSTLVDVSNFFTDNLEFAWVALEKVTPIVIQASAQQPGAMELTCSTMPQYSSYDNRSKGVSTTMGFASVSNTYTVAGQACIEYSFQTSDMGKVKVPYDMIRGKLWAVHLRWLNRSPLASAQIMTPYVMQVGVYV